MPVTLAEAAGTAPDRRIGGACPDDLANRDVELGIERPEAALLIDATAYLIGFG